MIDGIDAGHSMSEQQLTAGRPGTDMRPVYACEDRGSRAVTSVTASCFVRVLCVRPLWRCSADSTFRRSNRV